MTKVNRNWFSIFFSVQRDKSKRRRQSIAGYLFWLLSQKQIQPSLSVRLKDRVFHLIIRQANVASVVEAGERVEFVRNACRSHLSDKNRAWTRVLTLTIDSDDPSSTNKSAETQRMKLLNVWLILLFFGRCFSCRCVRSMCFTRDSVLVGTLFVSLMSFLSFHRLSAMIVEKTSVTNRTSLLSVACFSFQFVANIDTCLLLQQKSTAMENPIFFEIQLDYLTSIFSSSDDQRNQLLSFVCLWFVSVDRFFLVVTRSDCSQRTRELGQSDDQRRVSRRRSSFAMTSSDNNGSSTRNHLLISLKKIFSHASIQRCFHQIPKETRLFHEHLVFSFLSLSRNRLFDDRLSARRQLEHSSRSSIIDRSIDLHKRKVNTSFLKG